MVYQIDYYIVDYQIIDRTERGNLNEQDKLKIDDFVFKNITNKLPPTNGIRNAELDRK